MLKISWGESFTRGMYKYLSNQAHSLPMAFARTAQNNLYTNDSAGGDGHRWIRHRVRTDGIGPGMRPHALPFPGYRAGY